MRRGFAAAALALLLAAALPAAAGAAGIDYAPLGVPAADHPWSPKDYERAQKGLAPVAEKDPSSLPRLGAPDGVFARMVSPDNFSRLYDKSHSVAERLGTAVAYVEGLSGLAKLYAELPYKQGKFTSEAAALVGQNLDLMAILVPLADEFLGTLSVNERKSPARLDGYNTMIAGLAESVGGVVVCLGEREVWSDANRLTFLAHLDSLLAVVEPKLAADFRRDLPVKLRAVLVDETDPAVKARLTALIERLTPPPAPAGKAG